MPRAVKGLTVREITFAGTITVSDGPILTVNQPPLPVEVCELAQLTLAAGESKTVSFGSGKALLEFLSLTASKPGLKYAVNPDPAAAFDDAASPTLEYPLVLIGQSVIAGLDINKKPIVSITLKNPLADPVDLNVIAARPAAGN